MTERIQLQSYLQDRNVKAFLRVIRHGETTQTDDAYQWLFGSTKSKPKTFESFADHPQIRTYEAYDGQFIKNDKIDFTTAAGAYQITFTTWKGARGQYGFEDFSPKCQDECAVALIVGRGAIHAVLSGDLEEAIRLCRNEWASLPGSSYGQPTIQLSRAKTVYEQYGGIFELAIPQEPTGAGATVDEGGYEGLPIHEEQEPAPVEERSIPSSTGEDNMAIPIPFLLAAFNALSTYAPDIIRLVGGKSDNVERNAQVVEKVINVAKEVTSAASSEEAVGTLASNPMLQERFRAAIANNMNEWLGMVSRLHELDEASRDKARAFSSSQRTPVLFGFSFIELLTLVFVLITAAGATSMVIWGNLSNDLKAGIVTMMIIGGWNGVKEFWFGSSLGSLRKDAQNVQRLQ